MDDADEAIEQIWEASHNRSAQSESFESKQSSGLGAAFAESFEIEDFPLEVPSMFPGLNWMKGHTSSKQDLITVALVAALVCLFIGLLIFKCASLQAKNDDLAAKLA